MAGDQGESGTPANTPTVSSTMRIRWRVARSFRRQDGTVDLESAFCPSAERQVRLTKWHSHVFALALRLRKWDFSHSCAAQNPLGHSKYYSIPRGALSATWGFVQMCCVGQMKVEGVGGGNRRRRLSRKWNENPEISKLCTWLPCSRQQEIEAESIKTKTKPTRVERFLRSGGVTPA